MAGIYIHIPFCKQACHYCNFHFSASSALLDKMVNAICKEIALQQGFFEDPNLVIETIYFGGGTPSLLPVDATAQILTTIKQHFKVDAAAEITLEANPDDISLQKLIDFKAIGINRLSMGVQSFKDEDLIWMNRAHRSAAAIEAIKLAKEVGITNISIDLIYGIPTLTDENWMQNIDTAVALEVQHLSCYALTVEPKTALSALIQKGEKEDIDTAKQAAHFDILTERTMQAGYEQYEFSNFSLPGFRSKHNTSYWQQKKYLGIGPSAHSFTGNTRQWNIANNALYINSIENNTVPFESEILSERTQYNEYMMTSLRTIEGCSYNYVLEKFGESALARTKKVAAHFIQKGQLLEQNNNLKVTQQGKFFLDGIAADFFEV
ncbi:MAG: radical SAM family heme chaperone HemW [Sediminibacterium sp.]